MKKLFFIFFIYLIVQPNVIYAQNPYIREGSIGKNTTPDVIKNDSFPFRPISSWIGERFIFLPRSKSTQKYGYQSFKGSPSYDKYVGRIAKVISVKERTGLWDINFEMEDNGHKLTATAYTESIDDIAPVADIDSARSKWLGKTLWLVKNKLDTYNEDIEEFGSVKLKKYSPVKVIDIVCGWYNHIPVRFILKTSTGEEGFEDINLSGTNVSAILRDNGKFEDYFFTQDPRTIYQWPNRVWSSIEEGKVFVGMSVEQAKMSWGKPEKVNKTVKQNIVHEQWVYDSDNYLYFENGVLITIQN